MKRLFTLIAVIAIIVGFNYLAHAEYEIIDENNLYIVSEVKQAVSRAEIDESRAYHIEQQQTHQAGVAIEQEFIDEADAQLAELNAERDK